MELYHYTTLESFFKMLSGAGESGFLGMELSNYMYSKDASGEPYGLSILRKAIGMYELNHQIPAESSKVEVPFFRNDRRMLVGPEQEMYIYPLTECQDSMPWWKAAAKSTVQVAIGLDYKALVEYCMNNNKFLLKCKYDDAAVMDVFVKQFESEYDTFDFDEEHSRFSIRTKFFSMMYNACLEVKDPALSDEREWRIASFVSPQEADYVFKNGLIEPIEILKLPSSVLKSICIRANERFELIISGILGLLEKEGFDPELIEIRKSALQ